LQPPSQVDRYKYNHHMLSNISFGVFDLSGVIMLVLAGTSFVYLLRLKNKSASSQMLLWFFLCIILSAIATIVTDIGTAWDWAFAPSQDAMIILGGVFLARFAYLYPDNDQPKESFRVVTFLSVIASIALLYAVTFAFRYIANLPGDLTEYQGYYLILPIMIVLTTAIFFRRSIHYSKEKNDHPNEVNKPARHYLTYLARPSNRFAIALRNYGLALSVSLIPVVALVLKSSIPVAIQSFLFNFGAVIAISLLMLTYLNYAPESVSISVKLVGLSLASILLILGIAGVWLIESTPGPANRTIVITFIMIIVLSSFFVLFTFPLFFRNAIIFPIESLIKGIKVVNAGDFNIEVAVQNHDEIGYLTTSFNQMTKSLNYLTQELQNDSIKLEQQVNDRTLELSKANLQLSVEVEERKAAEHLLDRQLSYQEAISSCSQSLLCTPGDTAEEIGILNQALEYLRIAAKASRAYIHQRYLDPEIGTCIRIYAEVSEPGILQHINLPINQRIPVSALPHEMIDAISLGIPYGGPTTEVFASTPVILENLLNQQEPLLSIEVFPIILNGEWWGYVGFDDVVIARRWDDWEISLLRTASEMIGNTKQRWDTEAELKQTLDILEIRVQKRTEDLNQSNLALLDEIHKREELHQELENRLHIEQELAVISSRLQEIANPRTNMIASLEDLGHIMGANGTFLIECEPNDSSQIRDEYEWHLPELSLLPVDMLLSNIIRSILITERLHAGKIVFLENIAQIEEGLSNPNDVISSSGLTSLLIKPLLVENDLRGVLGCMNIPLSVYENQTNMRAFELVAGIMSNLLQREYLIQTLEEQVTERTRQLTGFLDMAMISEHAQELADVLQPILVTIMELTTSDACCIHLVGEGNTNLELDVQQGIPFDNLDPLRNITITTPLQEWLEEGADHLRSDLEQNSRFPASFNIQGFNIFYPSRLKAAGRTIGMLSCYRMADNPFSTFQSTILSALGELLGIIVENHRLRNEVEELAIIEERQRLAREIHDAISQSVYSLSLFARSARDAQDAKDDEKLSSSLHDLEVTSLQAMREMRLLLYQLRETGAEEDIPSVLEARFNQVERRLGLHATCLAKTTIVLPKNIRHEVWRIIIEGLNNIIKHASASNVLVELTQNTDHLVVNIQDDGVGFNTQLTSPGMGLNNIKTRADRLAGVLQIQSSPTEGTQILLDVPLAGVDIE
jgi:nitrate/nitrite-specific signal transduction histidine kinase